MISKPENPICIALDSADPDTLRYLAEQTRAHVGVFKIGLTAWTGAGPGIVAPLAEARPVFVDLKLHDIPSQVEGAVAQLAELGASYTTVHALGGSDMIRAAVGAAAESLAVLGVTVLTSLDDDALSRIGVDGPSETAVLRLADVALDAGARGLVCSAHELVPIRKRFGEEPILVVPGIRPAGGAVGDQRRVASPKEAIERGADIVVVGRPITNSSDPGEEARALVASLRS